MRRARSPAEVVRVSLRAAAASRRAAAAAAACQAIDLAGAGGEVAYGREDDPRKHADTDTGGEGIFFLGSLFREHQPGRVRVRISWLAPPAVL